MQITIDPEFHALIPPLQPDEYQGLEKSLIKEGCRDALVLWNDILIDGHNRYEICTRLNIPYNTIEIELPDRNAAMDWIDANQLGRRNLTPDQMRVIRSRLYNRQKKTEHDGGKGKTRSDGQNDRHSTAEVIAKASGVSERTVRRDAKVVEKFTPEEEKAVLKGEKKFSDVRREQKRKEVITKLEDIKTVEVKAIEGIYDVIVIDPPWQMEKIERDVTPEQVGFDYPTMAETELATLNIPTAADCHVWLWTTHKHLPMAFRLLNSWGLKYVCTFVWHKNGGFQPWGLPQYNCEFILYARKGTPQFIDTKDFMTCFNAPRQGHSIKPDEFYNTVCRVTAGRRLDMFGRRQIDGFDSWGKESV